MRLPVGRLSEPAYGTHSAGTDSRPTGSSQEILNGGKEPIDLDTTVVTVLDAEDQQIAPVYVEEADVADFAGKVKPGKTAKARYAFAVPKASRSQVTVVVDFDGVHTSAVFRGGLS